MEWSQHIADQEELSDDRMKRWKSLWKPYSELSEDMKDHDREWADKVLDELEDPSHVDVLVDSLHQLAGEAEELEARDDVDDHLQHIIEGLRFQAQYVQEWLNEHYYIDPINVVDNDQNNGDDAE